MAEIRIREAEAAGAEIIITACPLCLIMLEDARKTSGLEDAVRVMDLNELVATALSLPGLGGENHECCGMRKTGS
jgi:Fe-S oxidoreductase